MTKQTEAMKLALEGAANYIDALGGDSRKYRQALAEQPAQQEPVAWLRKSDLLELRACNYMRLGADSPSIWAPNAPDEPPPDMELVAVYTSPPAQRKPLTAREIELIDGMIEVQLDHAARCDNIPNRVMAEKQKGWDMERVELLRKLKEKNT